MLQYNISCSHINKNKDISHLSTHLGYKKHTESLFFVFLVEFGTGTLCFHGPATVSFLSTLVVFLSRLTSHHHLLTRRVLLSFSRVWNI